jgi:hypothetical protein
MTARVDLLWLPLGAGGHSVRWNGRVYEMTPAARGDHGAVAGGAVGRPLLGRTTGSRTCWV